MEKLWTIITLCKSISKAFAPNTSAEIFAKFRLWNKLKGLDLCSVFFSLYLFTMKGEVSVFIRKFLEVLNFRSTFVVKT